MKKYLHGILAAGMLGGLLLSTGCTTGYYAGGGSAYYDYNYYPDRDVYYYPKGRVYYWNEGGNWRSGGNLPQNYAPREHEQHYQTLHTHSQQPWSERKSDHPDHPDSHH